MASEWWFPPENLRVRLTVCGHAMLQRDVPAAYTENGEMTIKCPVCDMPQEYSSVCKFRDGVPTAALGWGEAQCVTRRVLKAPEAAEVRPKSLEGLMAAMSKPGVHHIDLKGAALKLGRRLQEQGPTESLVLRAWPAGCTVTGGVLHLPKSAVLLLTGSGACFKGTSFIGQALVVCCGDTFSATFRGCLFSSCSVYTVHGASTTLRLCALAIGSPAIIAHGPATCVSLHSCPFNLCITAVAAECGATIIQHRCTIQRSRIGIAAHDSDTRVSCTDSVFSGLATPEDPENGVAVEIRDAKVSLRRCSVERFMHGVYIFGSAAAVELRDCTVIVTIYGISAVSGAAIMLRNTKVELYQPPPARRSQLAMESVPVEFLLGITRGPSGRSGRRAQIERCQLIVTVPEQGGVHVTDGGALAVTHSHLQCGGSCLSVFHHGSTVTATHCTLRSETSTTCSVEGPGASLKLVGGWVAGGVAGARCKERGMLAAKGTVLSGARSGSVETECAVDVQRGGEVKLFRCSLRHVLRGVQVDQGAVTAHDVTISDLVLGSTSGDNAGYVQWGGSVKVYGGCVRGCCVGARSQEPNGGGESGVTELDGVSFEGNEVGVHMGRDAALRATCCVFSGDWPGSSGPGPEILKQSAVIVTDTAGQALLQRCTFKDAAQGVRLCGQQGHSVSDCVFLDGKHRSSGYWCALLLQGAACIKHCVFADTPCSVGVATQGCTIMGCHFLPGVAAGLMVSDGEATLSACRFDGCSSAIQARSGAVVNVRDSEFFGAETGMDLVGSAIVTLRRTKFQGGDTAVHLAAEGVAGPKASLVECEVSGAAFGGVMLRDAGASATLDGCTLDGCANGVAVMPGGLARVTNTRMLRCGVGMTLSITEDMLSHECGVCWRSGGRATASAWARLLEAGGTGVAGARCVHDGAYALATLRDVDIQGGTAGLQVHAGAHVDAERVEVRGCMTSFTLVQFGVMSRFEQCRAICGNSPSVISQRRLRPDQGRFQVEVNAVPGIEVVNEGSPRPLEEGWSPNFEDSSI